MRRETTPGRAARSQSPLRNHLFSTRTGSRALRGSPFVFPINHRSFDLAQHRIVAVGLLTEQDLQLLGEGFNRLWPVDDTPCFTGLLEAIDKAERELWRERDREPPPSRKG